MSSRKLTRSVVIGVTAIAIGGGSYGIVSATTASGSSSASSRSSAASSGGAGSNARSGPEPGGSAGTVTSTSTSGFTLTTAGDQKVIIKETASTTYENGTRPASANVVTKGQPVLVLGTADSATITATEVIAHPPATTVLHCGGGDPLLQGHGEVGKDGRPDPGGLHAGAGHNRHRNSGGQSHRSLANRLPWGRRRPSRTAEQRRLRSPQHRRQLAAPRLRQPGLPGHRRQRLAARGRGGGTVVAAR